jgi:hypothetical protein
MIAQQEGVAAASSQKELEMKIDAHMWSAAYPIYTKKRV